MACRVPQAWRGVTQVACRVPQAGLALMVALRARPRSGRRRAARRVLLRLHPAWHPRAPSHPRSGWSKDWRRRRARRPRTRCGWRPTSCTSPCAGCWSWNPGYGLRCAGGVSGSLQQARSGGFDRALRTWLQRAITASGRQAERRSPWTVFSLKGPRPGCRQLFWRLHPRRSRHQVPRRTRWHDFEVCCASGWVLASVRLVALWATDAHTPK